ncbi:MAG: DUF6807 family protein [Planctomycetota bacterium]|jgi:hypothetical protein
MGSAIQLAVLVGACAMSLEGERRLVVPASRAPLHIAVGVPEDAGLPSGAAWTLVEERGRARGGVRAEVIAAKEADGSTSAKGRTLVAVIPPGEGDAPRSFRLRPGPKGAKSAFSFKPVSDLSLGLFEGDRPVFVYNHGTISREGVPKRYDRANYFHPIYGMDGEVLTDDFPKDHYHHRGMFWGWPTVRVGEGKGNTFNSWIPKGFDYRFERWTCRHAGKGAAALGVESGWHAGGRKVVHERMLVVVHPASGEGRALDIEFVWTALDVPVTLKGAGGKGYGGLTFRFHARKGTVVITVPSGRTKKDLVAKRLEWADLSARFAGAKGLSGASVFVDPGHPRYPPVWLTRHYGPLCVGWPGIEEGTLEPGKPVTCRYRVWIHRGNPEVDVIRSEYEAYKKSLQARVGLLRK